MNFFQGEQRKVEQRKYGIEYDDEYDYLQHLRDPCEPPERYAVHVDQTEEDEEYEDDDDEEEEEADEDNVKTITKNITIEY